MHFCLQSFQSSGLWGRAKLLLHEAVSLTTEGRRLRRARFSFELCGIAPGEVVEFWYTYRKPSGILCPVLDGEHVEYEGRAWSLSGLARRLTGAVRGVPGPSYFKYRGEWLNDLRDRLGQ